MSNRPFGCIPLSGSRPSTLALVVAVVCAAGIRPHRPRRVFGFPLECMESSGCIGRRHVALFPVERNDKEENYVGGSKQGHTGHDS
jgi:hypothetical protein